jgi:hypothetical protein
MKAIIEFNLPEDGPEFKIFNSAQAMYSVLWDFQQEIRDWQKRGHGFKDTDDAVERISIRFHELLSDEKIDLN